MSGVTPLVDTLLATRLGQRVDLVPLKAQSEIAGPGAVTHVEQVVNDVRLPSREALQRELGVGIARRDGPAPKFSPARPGGAVTLSAAARAVSALLNLPLGTTPAVRGQAPLQPDMRVPAVPVLAAGLARTVAESGLFYESHLQQYAAGQRTLAQLAREPQAGLVLPSARVPGAGPSLPAAAAASSYSAAPAAADLSPSQAAAPRAVPPDAGQALNMLETPEIMAAPMPELAAPPAGGDTTPAPGSPVAAPGAVAQPPGPAAPATTYGRTGLPDHQAPSSHDFSLQDPGVLDLADATTGAARAGHPAATIHPDAVGLVRQQLEMLAVPVFRWSGEGWPGVPMDWEIRQQREEHQEHEGRQGGAADDMEAAPAAWTTRMTLKLPRLGTVDVRLGLSGTTLQLRLNASQAGTAAVLDQARAGLPQRFGAVGLELTDLQIGGAQRKAGTAQSTGEGHAG
ncbi:flagellar hook-length control protein FliK [Polaromonas sp. YR568]|uniref:flagellar hook-length control protein FliK n=1 Tax=Polaromonas sp. YR568 TaxID=1855301 RepID=UPI00398BFB42